MTFNHIERTNLTEAQVKAEATRLIRSMIRRFGPGSMTAQEAVDAVIDGAIEAAQG